jgi:predicted metal-dependent hydrolase
MKIIRSKRKTVAIIVEKDGSLIIRAPLKATRSQIDEIVEVHRAWIEKKQAEAALRKTETQAPRFLKGDQFWFLGSLYPLAISEKTTHPLKLQTNRFVLSKAYIDQAPALFEQWYKLQAHLCILLRVEKYAQEQQLNFTSIRITSARTRWGSCSSSGGLNFSWRLVMAPLEVIDYVVVHELAHLIIRNHSKAFWAEVARMLPAYNQQRLWLKKNGHRLSLDQARGTLDLK